MGDGAPLFVSILGLIFGIIFGYASQKIISDKGYPKEKVTEYFWIGFFLGIIGLIIAASQKDVSSENNDKPADNADALLKYKALLDAGAITEQEFEMKKRELLDL